tara:strand:+ start:192 stop:398 length:207 start_codon:yes stop_codon:yes gene_type:complete
LVSIKIREDEPFEKALRRFKKKWEKAGILRDVRSRQHYIKPSEQKKIAKRTKKKRVIYRPTTFSQSND